MAETAPDNAVLSVDVGQEGVVSIDLPDAGQVAIIGDCFAQAEAIDQAAQEVLQSGNTESLTRLPGNFSAVITKPRQVTALGSLSGDHCLYFGQTKDGGVISTRANLGAAPQPDTAHLTAQLVIPGAESVFADSASFRGVSKLLSGQGVTTEGTSFSTFTHTNLAPDPHVSFEEAAGQLREALIRAVQARVESGQTISTDFSGGMDSSSLAFLALRNLGDRGLPVFFADPPNPNSGDALYMEQFLRLDDRLRPHRFTRVPEAGLFTYDAMLALPVATDLTHTINMSPREKQYLRDYHRFVGEHQAPGGIHLNGHGGDEVVGSQESYLVDDWRNGNIRRFLSDGLGYARLHNVSPITMWHSMISLGRNGLSGVLMQAAHVLEAPPADDNEWNLLIGLRQPGGPGLQWLTTKARKELAEVLRAKAEAGDNYEGLSFGDYANLTSLRCAGQAVHARRQFVRATGSSLSLQAPFLDHDVIRAAFSVNAAAKASPHQFKRLLREALAGEWVPPEVLARTSKGSYDAGRALSAIRSLPALQALMRDPLLADLGIIEPGRVREALSKVDTASNLALWSLERVVSAELWLRRLQDQGTFTPPKQPNRASVAVAPPAPTPETPPPSGYLALGEHVHAVASPQGTLVIFNRATDKYYPLDRTRSEIARTLATAGTIEAAVTAMTGKYKGTDPAVIRADVARCCKELLTQGVFAISDKPTQPTTLPSVPHPIRLSIEDGAVAREKVTGTRLRDRLLAITALTVGTVALKRLKPEQRRPFLQKVQEQWCDRDATPQEADRIMRATQSLPSLGRVACLESSYTAALAAAFTRRRVDWHQGVSFAPLVFHAWIEAQGKPIVTGYDGRVTGNYQSFYTQ